MKRMLVAGATLLATLLALVAFSPAATAADGVPTTWKTVSARGETSCAIDTTDALWCWGNNNHGQVGDGTRDNALSPVRIGTDAWRSVTTSSYSTCAIRLDRSAYCWGYNAHGQAGTGTIGSGADEDLLAPTRVDGPVAWAKISPGFENGCGISTDRELYCWGYNGYGGVGDGSGEQRPSPVRIGTGTTWAGIQVAYFHACARTTAGEVSCWGYNNNGELGDGTTTDKAVPTPVAGTYAQISTTAESGCGVTTAGISVCWGYNGFGNLGDGTLTNRSSPTPLKVGSKSFSSVLGGYKFSCGVTRSQGKVRCFGSNAVHEFGDGTTTDSTTATDAAGGLTAWKAVSLGDYTACGLRASGALYCWGDNEFGQLGVGTTTAYDHRVRVGRTPTA